MCELEPSSDLCRIDYLVHLPVCCCWRCAGPGISGEECRITRCYHITNLTVDVCDGGVSVVMPWTDHSGGKYG